MLDKGSIDQKLYESYNHFQSELEEIEFEGDRAFLTCDDVLDAHYLICDHFYRLGEGIAGFGPKDTNMLSSAVARQLTSAGGAFVYNDIWDIAASLLFGLINDHPFHDGNKRTAFLSSVFFMLENNFTPSVDILQVEDFTVDVAEFNSKNGRHMEVSEIAPRFKSMFRRVDNRIAYLVTFNELKGLLSAHGCSMRDPRHNRINIYRSKRRVAQVGFPDWSKEVSRNAISTIRKSTGLIPENGVDAQVFFNGADPLKELIGQYEEPLKRLAYR